MEYCNILEKMENDLYLNFEKIDRNNRKNNIFMLIDLNMVKAIQKNINSSFSVAEKFLYKGYIEEIIEEIGEKELINFMLVSAISESQTFPLHLTDINYYTNFKTIFMEYLKDRLQYYIDYGKNRPYYDN